MVVVVAPSLKECRQEKKGRERMEEELGRRGFGNVGRRGRAESEAEDVRFVTLALGSLFSSPRSMTTGSSSRNNREPGPTCGLCVELPCTEAEEATDSSTTNMLQTLSVVDMAGLHGT